MKYFVLNEMSRLYKTMNDKAEKGKQGWKNGKGLFKPTDFLSGNT